MNDTVILTFTYPLIEPYFEDFLKSCETQTNKEFDIIIVNDGLTSLQSMIDCHPSLNVFIKDYKGTISENRIYGLNLAKQKEYKYVILADSDDSFSANRVQKTKDLLSKYEIVANEFDLVNINGEELVTNYISHRLKNGIIIGFEFIKEKNVIGFSNSAFRAGLIPEKLSIPQDVAVVDWFFYTLLLHAGHKAVFSNEMITYYRQYSDNMIGINNETLDNYKKKLALKAMHYRYLSSSFTEFEELAKKYSKEKKLTDIQVSTLLQNNKIIYPLWWENIKI